MSTDVYRGNAIICNIIWMICTGIFKLYAQLTLRQIASVWKATWGSIALHATMFVSFLLLTGSEDFSRDILITFYASLVSVFFLSRATSVGVRLLIDKKFRVSKTVAILGMNQVGLKLAHHIERQKHLKFAGFLAEDMPNLSLSNKVNVTASGERFKLAIDTGVDEIFICNGKSKMSDLKAIIREAEESGLYLNNLPRIAYFDDNMRLIKRGDFQVLCAREEPLGSIENRIRKRLFDIVVSSVFLIFIFSWLYPLLALIIKIQSPGPILIKQLRTGKDNLPFWCYKFRSSKVDDSDYNSEDGSQSDILTPIGRFMREASLEELPQFLNVLLGYMSVIGPKANILSQSEQCKQVMANYSVRQSLKPGISGWSQVNGYRGEIKDKILIKERTEHDVSYTENWSLMLDSKIIYLTILDILHLDEIVYD